MNGAAKAAFYGFPPNRHGYCGEQTFSAALKSYLEGKGGEGRLEAELVRFKAHHAYLRLIARENGLQAFDPEVVEAFWVGNKLLDNISPDAIRSFLRSELFPRERKSKGEALAESLPAGLVPHHSFNVLFVNFVTDAVERSVESFDSCCITSGRVISVDGAKVTMLRDSISSEEGRFMIKPVESSVLLEAQGIRLVRDAAPGDVLSVHWGMCVERLSPARAARLKGYTRINIEACNRSFIHLQPTRNP